ncbi:efflux RND transporter periplasmic adaptor subunit [Draconibacterium sediminis]|uniref:Uncharacterized protein n=1 Tax=Draconibacterium sediminis TaxID=1544798 RepID=A0A0D8JCS7_9BACT|nr:efflux RND transporter periplasmic adaptor subunit [Draconibacterium sediminis]KJF43608.1 hypothetical protein LH29_10835 [Draconibacterium sediminis]
MKKYSYIAALIFLVLLQYSCTQGQHETVENEEENEVVTEAIFTPVQYKNAGIELGHIEYKNLRNVVKSNGYLEVPPQNKANVAPVMGGIIKEIYVLEGNYVKKGQLLAKMEHPDFIKLQEAYIKALADFDYLEKEYARQKELSVGNVNAEKILQQTESNYKAARGQVHSLEAQLKMFSLDIEEIANGHIIPFVPLNSPINGYVGHINASIGTYTEPNQPIFDIVDNRKVHVDLMVYEKDIYKVKPGQKVDFVLTNQGSEIIKGKIFGISKSFEDETKALVVHANIMGKSPELIPGMFVNALIETGSDSVPAVPVQAVINEAGKEYIFIKAANVEPSDENIVFKRVEIKTGLEDLGYVEILPLDNLPPDSEIAIKGTFYIHSVFKPGVDEE